MPLKVTGPPWRGTDSVSRAALEDSIAHIGLGLPSAEILDRLLDYGEILRKTAAPLGYIGEATIPVLETVHLVDSLAGLLMFDRWGKERSGEIIDVGTGAGLPGLPIAIARPDIVVTLVDSVGRRADFLRATVEALGLVNVDVVRARAEILGRHDSYRERFDAALSRAVVPSGPVLELSLPFVRIGGSAILYKTTGQIDEIRDAGPTAAELGAIAGESLEYTLPGMRQGRLLALFEKTSTTPRMYPRRSGVPAKRPIRQPNPKAPG